MHSAATELWVEVASLEQIFCMDSPIWRSFFAWESPLESFFWSKASRLGFAGRVRVGLGCRMKFGQGFPWEESFVLAYPCLEAFPFLVVSLGGSFGPGR